MALSTFCTDGHTRIVHTEDRCPLCAVLKANAVVDTLAKEAEPAKGAGPATDVYLSEVHRRMLEEARLARIANGDLRHSFKGACGTCGHIFWAPTLGNCPVCMSPSVAKLLEQDLDIKRV